MVGRNCCEAVAHEGHLERLSCAARASFVAGLRAYGCATRREVSSWARTLFWGLPGLIVFGIVGLLVAIPNGNVIFCVLGLVIFGGLTIFDFNRLRSTGIASSPPMSQASSSTSSTSCYCCWTPFHRHNHGTTTMSMPGLRDDRLFPVLSASELSEMAAFGTHVPTIVGQLLFEAGEASYDLFVVLEGEAEAVRVDDPDAPIIAAYGPGGFVGELNLLTGQRRSVSCRVTVAGRVLVIAQADFRRLMSVRPALAETIFNALVGRRELLRAGDGAQAIRIVGSRYSPEAMSLRTFAEHAHLAYAWIDIEDADDVGGFLTSWDYAHRTFLP